MKTAIVYCSKHGTTEKVARLISGKLKEQTELIDLGKNASPFIENFERVIIGGSIYAGSIQKQVKEFCYSNLNLLMEKEVGLFICCMSEEKDKKQKAFNNAFPEALRLHSKANGFPGGELLLEKLNFLERLTVRIVAKARQSVSKINYPAIDQFVENIKMSEMARTL